jgi:hypothetical protein
MGWFKKKTDPISERADALTRQIEAIEAQIKDLASKKQTSNGTSHATHPAPMMPGQPRLRSTALPHGPVPASAPAPAPAHEPVFEELSPNPFRKGGAPPANVAPELGTRKNTLAEAWGRLKNHFRGPATSNPKLVNYLAAGSIQGLRPLRYEKRVARNRFLVLVALLILLLLGIFLFFFRR